MKKTTVRIWRSLISVTLVISLVLGSVSSVFATGGRETSKELNYVSIGASQTNGYGLQGYLPITVDKGEVKDPEQLKLLAGLLSGKISKNDINVYGYQRAPEGGYPDLIRDAFEAEGYEVNLDQLAISSMRAEEGRMLLDDEYYGDSYTEWRFYDENGKGWFSSAAKKDGMTNEEALAALRQEYQSAVKNADVITYDLGVNNFGVYAINRIDSGIDNINNPKFDADFSKLLEGEDYEKFMDMRESVEKLLMEYAGEANSEGVEMLQFMADTFAYALIGYCVNFDKSMEIIYDLNPDVSVAVVSIQNLMKGMTAKIPGVEDEIPLGDIYGAIVEMANKYASTFSPYAANNCYAEAGNVSLFLDDLLAYDGDPDSLTQDMRDCFGLYDNSLFGWELFVRSQYTNVPKEAVDAGVDAAYDALTTIAQRCAQESVLDFGALDKLDSGEDVLGDYIESALYGSLEAGMKGKAYELDLTVLDDPDLANAMAIAVRFNIGNSFFAHPNRDGHAQRAEVILEALEKGTEDGAVNTEKIKEVLNALCAAIEKYGPDALEAIKAYIEKDGSIDELNKKLQALEDCINAEISKVENIINDIEIQIEELEAQLDALQKELADASDAVKAEIERQIEIIENEIAILKDTVAKVEKALDDLAEAVKEIEAAVDDIIDMIEEGSADAAAAIAVIQKLIEDAAAAIKAVDGIVSDVIAGTKTALEEAKKIHDAVKDLIEYVEAEAGELDNAVQEALKSLEEAAENLAKQLEQDLMAIAVKIKDAVEKALADAYLDATTGEYIIDEDSYYVALGDGTAAGDETYVDRLAEEIGMADRYINLSQPGVSAEELSAVLEENRADIEKADFITLSLGTGEFIEFVMQQMDPDAEEMDWAELLGAKTVPYVEQALADVEAELLASGMTDTMAELVTKALESYAYAYVSFAKGYPEAVNAIHEINPDAQVVIVGMYNPLAGVSIDFEGSQIAVGEYVDYIVDLSNLHYTAYAMLTDNTIYVEAPDVETATSYENITYIEFVFELLLYPEGLYPSENGHEYIKNQILGAIGVKVPEAPEIPDVPDVPEVVWGDSNGDGKANVKDAVLALQYANKKITADKIDMVATDVNGDGKVTVKDATLILQHANKKFDKFPVEE